jgi:hypothetical protein
MHPLVRYQGQAVEVRDRHGRVHRGVLEGMDPQRGGMFLRSSFFGRRFIPFFLIATIFLLSSRRRIF